MSSNVDRSELTKTTKKVNIETSKKNINQNELAFWLMLLVTPNSFIYT